jgi:hypothetical protein
MSIAYQEINAGKQLFFSINKRKHSALMQQGEIFIHETPAVFFRRMRRQFPMLALHIMAGVWKRRNELSVFHFRAAAAMVKMEVR